MLAKGERKSTELTVNDSAHLGPGEGKPDAQSSPGPSPNSQLSRGL